MEAFLGLKELEAILKKQLSLLSYPSSSWIVSTEKESLDVVVIGGGMAGLAAAFALKREGITHIQVLDASPEGYEGPWDTYARMATLRSGKELVGPALDIPALTFRSWYTAQHGAKEWKLLYKISTALWMNYLRWYRRVLEIPVKNKQKVTLVEPAGKGLRISIADRPAIFASKVVFATGRSGFGGLKLPEFVQNIPKSFYAHTNEEIDFKKFKGKALGILGVGASAFDAAASALEAGAGAVMMLGRREEIPPVNKLASLSYPGFSLGFFQLPNAAKIEFMQYAFVEGSPPPFESLDRVSGYANLKVLTGTNIEKVSMEGLKLQIATDEGLQDFDFLILATGFEVDGRQQPELRAIFDDMLLWQDRMKDLPDDLGHFPYLGDHFEFLEKKPGEAPYLKNIYCFNYAATLSHGLLSSDIPAIGIGATRLAQGIASDFFTQHWEDYYRLLQKYTQCEFDAKSYPFIQ